MVSHTNEQALEAAIEKALTGLRMEDVKAGISEPAGVYATQHNGFQQGFPKVPLRIGQIRRRWEAPAKHTEKQGQPHKPIVLLPPLPKS